MVIVALSLRAVLRKESWMFCAGLSICRSPLSKNRHAPRGAKAPTRPNCVHTIRWRGPLFNLQRMNFALLESPCSPAPVTGNVVGRPGTLCLAPYAPGGTVHITTAIAAFQLHVSLPGGGATNVLMLVRWIH